MTKWLDKQVNLCEQYGMYAVIDYHAYDERDLNNLMRFWNIIAPRYANRNVLYEVMNEPSKGNNRPCHDSTTI
jgi:aryl-phospho-beta-D-glucosidase BglC (GH1 family)